MQVAAAGTHLPKVCRKDVKHLVSNATSKLEKSGGNGEREMVQTCP